MITYARRGYLTFFTVTFAAIFISFLAMTVNYVVSDVQLQKSQEASAAAFAAAEAGAEYYLWHLAALPNDLLNIKDHPVVDPSGASDSSFTLTISPVSTCNMRTSVTAVSKGIAAAAPLYAKTITARYAQPTLFGSSSPHVSETPPDFAALKAVANASGRYFPYSNAYGYSVVFNSDGSFDVRTVTGVTPVDGYSAQGGWKTERSVIASTGAATHYSLPSCGVIFIADTAWVSGVVNGKVMLAAANIGSTTAANVYLPSNLTYAERAGDGLVVAAQGSVLITLNSPDTLVLQGGFIAAGGDFGRNEYLQNGTHAVPSELSSYVLRSSLSLMGAGVAQYATTTKWFNDGAFVSGYSARTDAFDRMLVASPPPMTPTTTSAFHIVEFRQN